MSTLIFSLEIKLKLQAEIQFALNNFLINGKNCQKGASIMKSKLKNGYSTVLANFYVNEKKDVISLSPELEPQYKWEDKGTTRQPTNEIVGYRAWFSIKGEQPFQVKFLSKVSLPPYLSKVKLEGLEACDVRNKIYFRASDIKEVQK